MNAKQLADWIWNSPQKTHNQLDEAILAYGEAERKAGMMSSNEKVWNLSRQAALEEVMEMVNLHSTQSFGYSKEIRVAINELADRIRRLGEKR